MGQKRPILALRNYAMAPYDYVNTSCLKILYHMDHLKILRCTYGSTRRFSFLLPMEGVSTRDLEFL